jgi:hypothetical protein
VIGMGFLEDVVLSKHLLMEWNGSLPMQFQFSPHKFGEVYNISGVVDRNLGVHTCVTCL